MWFRIIRAARYRRREPGRRGWLCRGRLEDLRFDPVAPQHRLEPARGDKLIPGGLSY